MELFDMEDHDVENVTELDEFLKDDMYRGSSQLPKIKKVENFAKELNQIANFVYKIEKDIVVLVEKNETKPNKKASVLSMLADNLENDCLMSIYNFFTSSSYKVGVLCFDGLMVEKTNKPVTNDILKKCEKKVESDTKYKIKLEIKKMDEVLELPILSSFVKSDKEAQEKLFSLENPNYFKYCKKELYIFNEKTGMYDNDITTLHHYMVKHKNNLLLEIKRSKDITDLKSYGEDSVLMKKVIDFVKEASKDDGWLERTAMTSIGYLLYQDGIYNMNVGEFKKGFDPNIVFHCRIDRDFPQYNKEHIKYASDISFGKFYGENRMAFIVSLACALAGKKLKKFYFCPGRTNAGKSKLVNMLKKSFGTFVGTFNAESLACTGKMDTKDEAARMRWAFLARFVRILTSNEADMKRAMSGEAIKKQSSGSDMLTGRTHHGEETDFEPHYTIFCLLNDVPTIDPLDDVVIKRLEYFEFPYQFTDKITQKYQKKADPHLDDKINEDKFIAGFTHLILDGYKYYLENGMPEYDDKTKIAWTEDDKQNNNIIETINKEFEITNNNKNTITVSQLKDFRAKNKKVFATISSKRFNEILRDTLKLKEIKLTGGTRGWAGIKHKNEF